MELSTPPLQFDRKYKTVLEIEIGHESSYLDIVYWLDQNTKGQVEIKHEFGSKTMALGFENSDDALMFKLRFSK